MPQKLVRISFPWKKASFNLDPAMISYAYEGIIIDNMYSNLITFDDKEKIVGDLAEEFFWDGSKYSFKISGTRRTSTGEAITSEDVVYSLKRLLALNQNSHGKLSTYLCGGFESKSLNSECKGISRDGDWVHLTPAGGISKDIILSLLVGIDFKILPKKSFSDEFPYKILDYSNTTGAYFLASGISQNPEFKANEHFPFHSKNPIMHWQIAPSEIIVSSNRINRDFDLVTTASFIQLDSNSPELSVFSTYELSMDMLVFTQKGQNHFSLNERAYVAGAFKNAIANGIDAKQKPSMQIFPTDSVARLSIEDEKTYAELYTAASKPLRVFTLGIPKSVFAALSKNAENLRELNIVLVPFDITEILNNRQQVDGAFVSTDSAFHEDISLLEYNFNFGFFGFQQDYGTNWMKRFVSSEQIDRVKLLKDLHRDILINFRVAPLYSAAYYAVGLSAFDLTKMSKTNASTHLWKIEIK